MKPILEWYRIRSIQEEEDEIEAGQKGWTKFDILADRFAPVVVASYRIGRR